MTKANLNEIYLSLNKNVEKVFVVPKIKYHSPETDYLYRLYFDMLNSPESKIKVESFSVFAHPLIFLKFAAQRKAVLHYHWFEVQDIKSLAGIFWKLIWIILYKIIGGKIVWTVHNKYPHTVNFKSFNKTIRKFMASLADKLLVHCSAAIDIMTDVLNVRRDKFSIVEHPDFSAHIFDRAEAEKQFNQKYGLGINSSDRIFLMFGQIASYKGILECAGIFSGLEKNKKLIIAGAAKKGNLEYFSKLKNICDNSENIILIDKIIPESEVPIFFNLADYVIFNYNQVLTSGGIILALNYNKKIIAPKIGCIPGIKSENILLFDKSNSSESELHKLLKNT
ncbi:MAG: hypothetical protein HND52_05470 [Ignavibacteriae bacterium]|nr:hypothetical protein [Ignavibacteriota bacterium]NOG97402.1 hypothetical protein [Ignavibacteriota bacterium]